MVKKKKPVAKRARKSTMASSKVPATKSPVMVTKTTWISWFKVGSAVVVFALIAGLLTLSSPMLKDLQANLLSQFAKIAQVPATNVPTTTSALSSPGVLIAYDLQGENERKLLDIFATVFPDADIRTVAHQSTEGADLVSRWGVAELPALFFEQSAFESEKLSTVVKDLFVLRNGYYGLNVSLVNPSGQTRIKGPLNADEAVWVGDNTAPITVYVYSDVKCQHCRAQERNNQDDFKKLIDEGIIRVAYLDLPQNADSMLYSTAMNCLYELQQNPENYLAFRATLFNRPNLSKAFTLRELSNAGIDYDTQCHADATQVMFRNRLKVADADGITGVPALYIGKTGGTEFIRFTGDKQFTEYQAAFDKLLGQGVN